MCGWPQQNNNNRRSQNVAKAKVEVQIVPKAGDGI